MRPRDEDRQGEHATGKRSDDQVLRQLVEPDPHRRGGSEFGIASANFSFPRAERWERPTGASFKASRLHPRLLLQGPELKFGLCMNIFPLTF